MTGWTRAPPPSPTCGRPALSPERGPFVYFEDFAEGLELVTRGRTVFDYDIGSLIGLAGLYEELFMNREYYERESVFRRRVAPGLLTLTLAEGLVMSEEWFRGTGLAFLGLDQLRLHAPVSPGDTIRVHVSITL